LLRFKFSRVATGSLHVAKQMQNDGLKVDLFVTQLMLRFVLAFYVHRRGDIIVENGMEDDFSRTFMIYAKFVTVFFRFAVRFVMKVMQTLIFLRKSFVLL